MRDVAILLVFVPPQRRDMSSPNTQPTHRADIQGLRGLAVLLVVAFHVRHALPGGYVGVDVFFVISGFVITNLLRSQVRTTGTMGVREFFARRVRRLLPLLSLTLTVTAALGVLLLSPLGASVTTSKTAVAAALLNANTFLPRQTVDYFALAPDANALLHTWSLSVEEQFYLLLPIALLLGLAYRRRSWSISLPAAAGVAALGVLSFSLYAILNGGHFAGAISRMGFSSPQSLAFYSAPTRAWEFLAGSLLALTAHRVRLVRPSVRDGFGLLGLIVVLGYAVLCGEATSRAAAAMLLPVVATMAILAAGLDGKGIVSSILSIRPAVVVGDVSYGWYLFHWPLIVFAAANSALVWAPASAAVGSLVLALMAKPAIEDRFRSRDRWQGRRLGALVAICFAVPVAVGLISVRLDRVLRIEQLDKLHRRHVPSDKGCNQRLSPALAVGAPECTWAVPHSVGRIVLIGDSHAEMWAEGVIRAGNHLGYDVSVSTMSGCPMVDGTLRMHDGKPDLECQRYITRSLQELIALHPTFVFLGAGSSAILADGGDAWQAEDKSYVTDVNRKSTVWRTGLGQTVSKLSAAGILSVVIHDVPSFEVTAANCGRLKYMLAPSSCASSRSIAAVTSERARSAAVEDAVVDASGVHVAIMDPLPWLCPAGDCSTFEQGTWMYRDRDHLSVAGSDALTPQIEAYLRPLVTAR